MAGVLSQRLVLVKAAAGTLATIAKITAATGYTDLSAYTYEFVIADAVEVAEAPVTFDAGLLPDVDVAAVSKTITWRMKADLKTGGPNAFLRSIVTATTRPYWIEFAYNPAGGTTPSASVTNPQERGHAVITAYTPLSGDVKSVPLIEVQARVHSDYQVYTA